MAEKAVSESLTDQVKSLAWSYGSDIAKKVAPILQQKGEDVKQLEELLDSVKEWVKQKDPNLYPQLLVFIEDQKKAQRLT